MKNIIKEIQAYKEELGLKKLSDDIILDCSTRIFNSQNIPRKSYSKEQYQNPEVKMKNPNEPATSKQIYALKKMGVPFSVPNPEKLTKLEASILIKEQKEKQEEFPDY